MADSYWKTEGQDSAVVADANKKVRLTNSKSPVGHKRTSARAIRASAYPPKPDAYWSAIRDIMRPAFSEEAEDYALMKGVGVIAMHSLFLEVLEHIRATHNSVFDVDACRAILAPVLEELQGDNAQGEAVVGIDFWRVGGSGAAGSFSSSAGRRVLLAKLRSGLPELEIQ